MTDEPTRDLRPTWMFVTSRWRHTHERWIGDYSLVLPDDLSPMGPANPQMAMLRGPLEEQLDEDVGLDENELEGWCEMDTIANLRRDGFGGRWFRA